MKPFLEVKNLSHRFFFKKTISFALENIHFSLFPGETLAIVGESGSGKSTLGKLILGFLKPLSGEILFEGKDRQTFSSKERLQFRQKVQVIFQNPSSSLSPKKTVEELLEEPFLIHKKVFSPKQIDSLLEMVLLPRSVKKKYPHEFSGGQKQRIAIARALALQPKFILCDEALSALDVSVQAQILSLLVDLKKEKKFSYLFITHSLAEVNYLADTVLVLQKGRQVEFTDKESLFTEPKNLYTKNLLEASQFLKNF